MAPLCRISSDKSGSVLPIMAGAILLAAVLIGAGVDTARAYKVDRRLQAACDSAVLAGRRSVTTDGFNAAAQTQANDYFKANFSDDEQQTHSTTFTPSTEDNGNLIEGEAQTTLNTIIMKIFGFVDFDLKVECSASMGVGNSDVMFVLDNTGSMAEEPDGSSPDEGEESKLVSLKKSMKAFYDTVNASVSDSNARIRYGFVPYSSSVNVGRLLNADYIGSTIEVQSRQGANWGEVSHTWNGTGLTTPAWGSWSHHDGIKYVTTKVGKVTTTAQTHCLAAMAAKPLVDETVYTDYGTSYNTTSTSVGPTALELVEATGVHQPQRMADYECRKSGSDYYIDIRYSNREASSYDYKGRPGTLVSNVNDTYTSAVYLKRSFDAGPFKGFKAVAVPFSLTPYPVVAGQPAKVGGTVKNVNYTWGGCILERSTTPATAFTFTSLAAGITPSDAMDLNIDTAPTSEATKWPPLITQLGYYRTAGTTYSDVGGATGGACPVKAQLLTEMDETNFDKYVDTQVATGSTYHDIGLIWGARLSSPSGMFATNVKLDPDNGGTVSRHLIFMTDGQLAPTLTTYSSFGIEQNDLRVTTDGKSTTQMANHRARFLAVCEAIKARGIRLWVIAFGTSLSADLVTCATDGLASAFEASDADELNSNFQKIANDVGELRVTQ